MKKILLIITCFLSLSLFAQNIKELYNEAETAMQDADYSNAIEVYKLIIEQEDHFPQVYLNLAHAYRLNSQYINAEKTYLEYLKHFKRDEEAYFWLAETQVILGEREKALQNYSQYVDFNGKNKAYINKAKHELSNSSNAVLYDSTIVLHKDSINPFIQAYGTYKYNDATLYNGIALHKKSTTNASFYVHGNIDSSLQNIICDTNFQITDFAKFPNKNIIITTIRNNKDSLNTPIQYYTIQIDSNWYTPKILDSSSTRQNYITIHPQIFTIQDKTYMIYSSNQEGGYGGMDIWYCSIENGSFSSPQNAGSKINTEGDEICPFFYTKNNTFYFSSNWHNSIGGFDIFTNKGWPIGVFDVYNPGEPINSSYNDLYYKIFNDTAYFSSNRSATVLFGEEFFYNQVYFYDMYEVTPNHNFEIVSDKINNESPVMYTPNFGEDVPLNRIFTIYFDHNSPSSENNAPLYSDEFENYVTQLDAYITENSKDKIGVSKQVSLNETQAFFKIIQTEYTSYSTFIDSISTLNITIPIYITITPFTSNIGSYASNIKVANQRAIAVKNDLLSYPKINELFKQELITITIANPHIPDESKHYNGFEIEAAKQRKVIVSFSTH